MTIEGKPRKALSYPDRYCFLCGTKCLAKLEEKPIGYSEKTGERLFDYKVTYRCPKLLHGLLKTDWLELFHEEWIGGKYVDSGR